MVWDIKSRTNTGGLTGRKLRWTVTFIATMGFSLFGYDQGLMSGLITGEQFNSEFPPTKTPTTGSPTHAQTIQGAVTSCYEIGCFFGALFALFRGDKIGRRPLIIAGSFIIIIGTVISVASFHHSWGLGQFVVGRVITGIGNGLNTATIPVWQSEMSKSENRGLLVNFEGSVVAIGTFVAYWIDFGLSYVHSSVQWRFPVAFQIVFAAVVFIGILPLPENAKGAAVGIFIFICFFAFTVLPLPWIYPPEINPMRTRTIATAVSTCTNWICNFAVVMFTPIFIGKSGWGCYLFFAVLNYLWIPIIFFFYPETAGRQLEEVDIIFAKAHADGTFPFRVAATMPKMNLATIKTEGEQLGLYDDDFEKEQFETKELMEPTGSGTVSPGSDAVLNKVDENDNNVDNVDNRV